MAKNKIYVVKVGRKTGIYHSWDECEKQIKGFSNAIYKSFTSTEEANKYLKSPIEKNIAKKKKNKIKRNKNYVNNQKTTNSNNQKLTNKNSTSKVVSIDGKIKKYKYNSYLHKLSTKESEIHLYYKDKPVNGEPTNSQYNLLKTLGKQKNLDISIIGINKREATELINYLTDNDNELKKPKSYNKYVKPKQ